MALALGYRHPDVMLRELTALQYAEWVMYYQVDPFGEQRADLRAGIIASTMSNRWRVKHEQSVQPIDFMPFAKSQEQTPEEIKLHLRSILTQVTQCKAK